MAGVPFQSRVRRWVFAETRRRPSSAKRAQAARLGALTAICIAAWWSVGAMHAVQGRRLAVLHLACGGLTLLVRWWGLRRRGRLQIASHLVIAATAAGLAILATLTGQHRAMAMWFMALLPLLSAYLTGVRASIGWTAVVLGLVLLVSAGAVWWPVTPEFVPGRTELLFNQLLLILMVLGFAVVTRRTVNRNVETIRKQTAAVRRYADELEQLRDRAMEASRAKGDFLASMSHELRTPLNSIIGFAGILVKQAGPDLDDKQRDYLDRIHRNGRHLLHLVNEVLDMSKIEAGKLQLDPKEIDPGALIRETVEQFETQAADKALALRAELPSRTLPLRADPLRLQQVLMNLIGNAVKFTDRGSVTVRLIADGEGRPRRIDVIDTGVGIPHETRDRIFESFAQAETTTARRYGGTGLGLPISRSLLEMMGFALALESEPDRGSVFSVLLAPGTPDRTCAKPSRIRARGDGGVPT